MFCKIFQVFNKKMWIKLLILFDQNYFKYLSLCLLFSNLKRRIEENLTIFQVSKSSKRVLVFLKETILDIFHYIVNNLDVSHSRGKFDKK